MAESVLSTQHKVLVTRPSPQGEALCQELMAQNISCEHIPALIIQKNDYDSAVLMRQLNNSYYDLIISISTNAVRYCAELTPELVTTDTSLLAIGQATRDYLVQNRKFPLEQVLIPEKYSSEGLLKLDILQRIHRKKIAIICGIGGRELLEQVLHKRGADYRRIEVYQRLYPDTIYAQQLQAGLRADNFHKVVVTSGEAVQNIVKMAGEQLPKLLALDLLVMSERIAIIARKLGFCQQITVIEQTDNRRLAQQIKLLVS